MTTQTMNHVQVNGATLIVRDRGAGEPVLFVHGGMGDECAAVVAEPAITSRYRVIDYHRRGWGESESPNASVSIKQQAADAVAILRHFDIDEAHLVGLSYGGTILLQIALDTPETVHTLALLEPALPSVLLHSPRFGAVMTEAASHYGGGNTVAAMECFGKEVAGDDFHSVFDRTLSSGYFERWVADADTSFQFDMPALQAWSFTSEEAARITQPVLNMTGAATRSYFREIYELIADWFPQAENVVLPDSTHAMFQTNPKGAAEVLARFFANHPFRS